MNDRVVFWGISILMLFIVVVWFVRFFGEMGANPAGNRFTRWCQNQRMYRGEALEWKEAFIVLGAALAVRVAVYLLGVFLCKYRVEYYMSLDYFGMDEFLDSWKRWDATHYIKLAELGYQDYIEDGKHLFLVFFPMYPWLVRLFHLVIQDIRIACLAVSVLAFCVGSVFFYGAVKEEYGKVIAKNAFLLLCCYPFSFFFGGMMTESLFFCLLSAGFFCIRRHKWLAAGIIGIFCALCRIQGILLLGVGMVEFCVTYKPVEMFRQGKLKAFWKEFFTKGIWLFLTVIGNLIYFGINQMVEGDPFRFQYYQKTHWYHTTTFLPNCIIEIISYIKGAEYQMRLAVWLPELVLFAAAMICIVYSLRRHPLRYSAFMIVYTVINYSVTFLISGGRYMLCALPMFVILAEWTRRKKWLYYILLLLSFDFMVMYFIWYLSGWQVM